MALADGLYGSGLRIGAGAAGPLRSGQPRGAGGTGPPPGRGNQRRPAAVYRRGAGLAWPEVVTLAGIPSARSGCCSRAGVVQLADRRVDVAAGVPGDRPCRQADVSRLAGRPALRPGRTRRAAAVDRHDQRLQPAQRPHQASGWHLGLAGRREARGAAARVSAPPQAMPGSRVAAGTGTDGGNLDMQVHGSPRDCAVVRLLARAPWPLAVSWSRSITTAFSIRRLRVSGFFAVSMAITCSRLWL